MSCLACQISAQREHHEFLANCVGCCARAAARGPHFFRVRKAGALDRQYRAMLQQFGLTHDLVKSAAALDVVSRGRA